MSEHYFEVDEYTIEISVEPIMALSNRVVTRDHYTRTRETRTDNTANIRRYIRFAEAVQPARDFRLRYMTLLNGYVSAPEAREWPIGQTAPVALGERVMRNEAAFRHERHGNEIEWDFQPRAGHAYEMTYEVLNGFSQADRHAHFHLPKPACYNHISLILDLSGYINRQFRLNPTPRLYFHPRDSGHDFCNRPAHDRGGQIVPVLRHTRGGVWNWEILSSGIPIQEGVLDLVWNFEHPIAFEPEPVEGVGLAARMGYEADLEMDNLRLLYFAGRHCYADQHGDGNFRIGDIIDQVGLETHTILRRIKAITVFFERYFRLWGHCSDSTEFAPGSQFYADYLAYYHQPPQRNSFRVPLKGNARDFAQIPCSIKLWNVTNGGYHNLGSPVARLAWSLARDFVIARSSRQ